MEARNSLEQCPAASCSQQSSQQSSQHADNKKTAYCIAISHLSTPLRVNQSLLMDPMRAAISQGLFFHTCHSYISRNPACNLQKSSLGPRAQTCRVVVIAMSATAASSESTAKPKYWLPTYGFTYPGKKGAAYSNRFFKPVEFHNNGESEEDEESMVTHTSSHVSVDSAYSSQSDVVKTKAACNKIDAKLHRRNLWKAFANIGNEMIVTKPGR